jgi:hypothetical protein
MTAQAEFETESLKIQALNPQAFGQFEELEQMALELWKKDQVSALELGRALVRVREACFLRGHGEWYRWFHEQGLDENRVHYCIRLAEETRIDLPRLNPSKYKKNLQHVLCSLPRTIMEKGARATGEKFAEALVQWLLCTFGVGRQHWHQTDEVMRAAHDFVEAFVRLFHLAVLNEPEPVAQEEPKPC